MERGCREAIGGPNSPLQEGSGKAKGKSGLEARHLDSQPRALSLPGWSWRVDTQWPQTWPHLPFQAIHFMPFHTLSVVAKLTSLLFP